MKMSTTTRKKGSGRTKGATSLIEVTLRELNRVLREDATVMVGRKYAEQLNLQTGKRIVSNYENISAAAPLEVNEVNLDEPKLEVKSIDF
tara:strand:+ start:126 stop:395 length:270 start_codon:yes stop_codon:yes gene_type:complete